MAKITYTNKVTLNPQPSIADENKVTSGDMNEIKSVVNGLIVNSYSTGNENTYSSNYLNNNQTNAKILWTNPNPTNAFNSQDVTLSSSDYDVLEIFYFDFTGTLNIYSAKTIKGRPCNLMALFQYQNHGYAGSRLVTYVSDTSYHFHTPMTMIESDAFGRHDAPQWCVPLYIIGYKTGLFS